MMKKNQDEEGKQQSTKTATRNNMSNNPPIHTHTHTHTHIHETTAQSITRKAYLQASTTA